MSIEQWSDNIIAVELQNDPQFTDDLDALLSMLKDKTGQDVVLDLKSVSVLNSSNIAKLLKLRKQVVIADGRQLCLCGLDTHVWGVFLVTGLDKVFEFADELSMGLASVQINSKP
jgi:anti-anti-sigma factor